MKCPKCRIEEMKPETYENIEVDRCPSCKGIYFDQGELKAMLAKKTGNEADTLAFSPTSDQMNEVRGTCFRCNKQMIWYKGPGGVLMDFCQSCGGIFLDQGELATIQLWSPS